MLGQSSRQSCWAVLCGVGVAGLLLVAVVRPAAANIVLLDEYWVPEITVNEVMAEEVDTQKSGDASQAKTGEFSVQLRNEQGAPSVRFRSAARVKLDEAPPGKSQAGLWYRTDAWTGRWRLEIWQYEDGVTDIPEKVMEAALDGGGADGALLADDQWHQARGPLKAAEAYGKVPHDLRLLTYIWLRPEGGWGVKHRTFVDRAEVIVEGSPPAPAPAVHVRPRPGAQVTGDGWIWWEGEDAVSHNLPPGGAVLPDTQERQAKLSNGDWLQHHGHPDFTATWQVRLPKAGRYTLWVRACPMTFRWRWQEGEWQEYKEDAAWQGGVSLWGGPDTVEASWARLGEVTLPAGTQTLTVKAALPHDMIAIDCWVLTRKPFVPDGTAKPRD
jgi:hypothetical protein